MTGGAHKAPPIFLQVLLIVQLDKEKTAYDLNVQEVISGRPKKPIDIFLI
jgi:hypothetical protein